MTTIPNKVFYIIPNLSQSAVLAGDPRRLGVDPAELDSLPTGELVHGLLGDVEALGGVVDGEDVDLLALVLEAVADAALGRVPAGDGGGAADVGEALDLTEGVPAVLGDEAVRAIGAGQLREGAGGDVVAGVVGDWMVDL